MASSERIYYKAVRRAVTLISSPVTLREKLRAIVRGTARTMASGVSLVLLDSSGKKLLHSHSWGLSPLYLKKDALDPEKSLIEVVNEEPVIISDVVSDKRVQHPEVAAKSGIVSILGIPVFFDGQAVGSLRVYTKDHREFTNQEISFVTTMAKLVSFAFGSSSEHKAGVQTESKGEQSPAEDLPFRRAMSVVFAHPSEEEFVRILDYYNIDWIYEPHSFPLRWQGDKVTEIFTPDFYLPGLDLYIELTTLKQSLVTEKNRKLRRLRKLYPDIKITLLYKKDYDRLLQKYGRGTLAETRARGIDRELFSATEISERVQELAAKLSREYADRRPILVGLQRGFLCFMADLIRRMTIPLDLDFMAISYYGGEQDSVVKITKDMDLNIEGRHVLIIEDVVDTGITLNYILNHLQSKKPASLVVCTLLDKRIRRIADVPLAYVGFEVDDEFVVGYGLDYREEYRNLPFIAVPSFKSERNKEKASKRIGKEKE